MTDVSQVFAGASEYAGTNDVPKVFGWRYNGRYHMPPLPGEETVKVVPNGQDPWVPYGIQSVTNMVDAFEESRGLNIWEQELALIGLALSPSLYQELVLLVHQWRAEGVDWLRIGEAFSYVRKALTGGPKGGDESIIGRAKAIAGGNEARQAGTNYHAAWEHRTKTGELIGTPQMIEQITRLESLLEKNGLVRAQGLSERVVRNVIVKTCGRFDDVLIEESTGRFLMADLKTKRRPFRSWMAVDAQLACYAWSGHMLTEDGKGYELGPLHYVDLEVGVVLQLPSDGGAPYLRPADLTYGWEVAQHARRVVDMRAHGKSVKRTGATWTPGMTGKNLEKLPHGS